ncbi:MAG TPA: polyketide synthase, partial [Ktedonobacteraceae bacterium]|nr:polyketide synthase [Ktedonobacteraceae bacterium]
MIKGSDKKAMSDEDISEYENALAIIGMSGRFPGAPDLATFWHNLANGVEAITFFSDEQLLAAGADPALLANPHFVKAAASLEQVEWFDAAFFGITPREAELMDPQHRLFLECAWQALEQAGYTSASPALHIGVFAGCSASSYLLQNLYPQQQALLASVGGLQLVIGNDKDHLPTRVSYKLNLTGPSISVNTACSTSLVALHLACQSVLSGECDLALAGGVSLSIAPQPGYLYQPDSILSPDGHCRAFDALGQGTIGGEGVGVIVVKRLEQAQADGDLIHAIIRGSAINNDGAGKVGYTAPSVEGQAAVISEALAVAGVEASSIGYVEAHGTATVLGDPIEVAALTQAFRASTDLTGFCALGSVKTNIGHLDAAAGIAGLLKTVLALQHAQLPPSLHFTQPNP